MSNIFYKKILPQYFEEVLKGNKDFELRKDEDDIQVGDRLILNEFDGTNYTGQYIAKDVKYVLRNCPQYGLMEGYCIIGLGKTMICKLNQYKNIDLQIEQIESARQELKKHFGEHYELSALTHTIPLLEELKELREYIKDLKEYWEMQNNRAYEQGRQDAFDDAIAYFEIHAHEVYNHISARDFICDRLEQLKENKE